MSSTTVGVSGVDKRDIWGVLDPSKEIISGKDGILVR
jgi:hypothetical protein